MQGRQESTLVFVLKGLLPYSHENILLAFKPNLFFNELERLSNRNQATLRSAYWRAKQRGYIVEEDKLLKITQKGLDVIKPYEAKKLGKGARLMVIFDIPEDEARLRRRLRLLLRQWHFNPVQKSVWISEYDVGKALAAGIFELGLEKYVQVYECAKAFPG